MNTPKPDTDNNELNNLVDTSYNKLIEEISHRNTNNTTITHFSDSNPASNPTFLDPEHGNPSYVPYETHLVLKHIKNKISSGLDGIPNIALKNLPNTAAYKYTILFNNIINNNYYPDSWKQAKVLPILKKGKDPLIPSSYRPISLLPNISKIFESLLNTTLTDFCNENKIIPDQQFGFRHEHSTSHAINKFLSDSMTYLNKRQSIAACLIDLEKAFDSVWLKGLFYKLKEKKISPYIIRLLYFMNQDRSFITVSNTEKSSQTFKVEEGLQQGTVNSPLIFNIYNSDVLNKFNLNNNNQSHSLAFADDLLVYCGGNYPDDLAFKLEKIVNKINAYYLDWHLKINPEKCETILIRQPIHILSAKKRIGKTFKFAFPTLTKTQLSRTNDK